MSNPKWDSTSYPTKEYPTTLPRVAEPPTFVDGDIVLWDRQKVEPSLKNIIITIPKKEG